MQDYYGYDYRFMRSVILLSGSFSGHYKSGYVAGSKSLLCELCNLLPEKCNGNYLSNQTFKGVSVHPLIPV